MDVFLVATRLILAAILGAVIGIEREIKNRAAGFRTHIIVSVGAVSYTHLTLPTILLV